ncbi:MAG: hypothetical protein ACKVT1_03990 [Dehalococcoidia bacterium]
MFTTRSALTISAAALGLLAAACGGDGKASPTTFTGQVVVDGTPAASATAAATSSPAATAPATATRPATQATAASTQPAATPTQAGPLTLTPSQTEGPYYPPTKPADRDNDLTVVKGGSGTAGGDVLVLNGTLLNKDGKPVAGATVEIWQVDKNGVYLHPQQPEAQRDKAFQSYGESVTDASGAWSFRTIEPPAYEGRPKHIHLKVRIDGNEVLTSQIYFEGDPLLANDGVSRNSNVSLMTVKVEATTEGAKQVKKASWRIVIS